MLTKILVSTAFLISWVVLSTQVLGQRPPRDALSIDAKLKAERLEPGQVYELEITTKVKEGWSVDAANFEALLQIAVPDSVTLAGIVLRERMELIGNKFRRAPYERVLKLGTETIRFTLKAKPKPGDRLEFNLLTYLQQQGSDDRWFVRRRITLPLRPRSRWKDIEAEDSSWGEAPFLQIGDEMKAFTLPRADGSTVDLAEHLYESNIIVATYLGFW